MSKTKYIESKRPVIRLRIDGEYDVTATKVTCDNYLPTPFYRYSIRRLGKELWFDSINWDNYDKRYWCASVTGYYTSIRTMVKNTAENFVERLKKGEMYG